MTDEDYALRVAAEDLILEWDLWQEYLREIEVEMPRNGIGTFLVNLEIIRKLVR